MALIKERNTESMPKTTKAITSEADKTTIAE
jgi:hypothetical protein